MRTWRCYMGASLVNGHWALPSIAATSAELGALTDGVFLLSAEFQTFTTAGETLVDGGTPRGGGVYPNHCHVLFPKTTHRLRLLAFGAA